MTVAHAVDDAPLATLLALATLKAAGDAELPTITVKPKVPASSPQLPKRTPIRVRMTFIA
jgi:hypothetical protein